MSDFEETLSAAQIDDDITINAKIYSVNQIRGATFLGGPLVAGYLIAENYKAFDEYDKGRRVWMIAIVFSIAMFALIFLLPENVHIPNVVIPLAYSWLTSILVTHYQGPQIKEHFNSGGQTYNWSRTIVIALIGTVITVALLFICAFMLDVLFPSDVN